MEHGLKTQVRWRMLDRLRPFANSLPDDFLSYNHFVRVVSDLNWNSSPGWPYMQQGFPTNREFFDVNDGIPSEESCRAIYSIVMEHIEKRYSDPIRVFVKPEPHKPKKVKQEMWRLISSVSVIDQIIDHMLFGSMNAKVVSDWISTSVKIGWTPLMRGWTMVPIANMVSTDKSAWDWTVCSWLIEEIIWLRKQLCLNSNPLWEELVDFRYQELFARPKFIFSNGLVLQQKFKGFMKSGCVNTIVDNSIFQMILDARVCKELQLDEKIMWVMGDDVLQERQPVAYFQRLAELCKLKQVSTSVEFAGMRFLPGGIVNPCYTAKHAFNLLHIDSDYLDDLAMSYSILYHRGENKVLLDKLGRVRQLPAKDMISMIFDAPSYSS